MGPIWTTSRPATNVKCFRSPHFSIEPGVYLDDFGIRSEVNMLLTEGKAEVTGKPIQLEVLCLIEDD